MHQGCNSVKSDTGGKPGGLGAAVGSRGRAVIPIYLHHVKERNDKSFSSI